VTAELLPGFTVLCVYMDERTVRVVRRAAAASWLVVACAPPRWWSDRPDGQVPLIVCAPDSLPILSHSADVVAWPAELPHQGGAAAEIRRVLAPGGLFIGYTGDTGVRTLSDCRSRAEAAGLESVDETEFAKRLRIPGISVTLRAPLRGQPST